MTKGAKIHRILSHMCADEKTSWYDTADIAQVLDMNLAEVNTLVREVIENGHAFDRSTKDQAQKRSIGVFITTATYDAFEMKYYLQNEDYIYHFYFNVNGPFNLLNENFSSLQVIISAYDQGKRTFTIHGDKTTIEKLRALRIYRSVEQIEEQILKEWCDEQGSLGKNAISGHLLNTYCKPEGLKSYPDIEEVTGHFIGNREYGNKKSSPSPTREATMTSFINKDRIEELRQIKSTEFDLTRLIRICKELNECYGRGNYLAVAALTRTLMNHVPPIFGFSTFERVASNYGDPKATKSLKASLKHLQGSMKNIADRHLHQPIRVRESLPSENQVNFSRDTDVLLEEVVRILKT